MDTACVNETSSSRQSRPDSSICITGYAPEILTRIYQTPIRLCIYKRMMGTDVKEYAIFLKNTFHAFQITQIVSLQKLNDLLCLSLPQHQYRQSFINDVYTVTEMFACLFGLHRVGFRLCVLNKAMCPRFHADNVPCRLITTYSGTGTEWIDGMTSKSVSPGTLNQNLESADSIKRLDAGDIALFKGNKWEGDEDSGVIHRSPAVDDMRLLLSLDIIH